MITTEDIQLPGYHGGLNTPQYHQNREGVRSGGSPEHVTHDANNKSKGYAKIPEHYG